MPGACPKRFEDSGTDVTVDLHGCTVEEAGYVIRRSVQEAHRRGRARVFVIHGKSGALDDPARRTIKGDLERMLADGELNAWVSGTSGDSAGGRTTLWIMIGATPNPSRIKKRDVAKG